MADATPESNLALIEELQELVSAEYANPEGPEFSFPAVGQAVDDEMWKYITLALGSGVLDTGGWPYLLTDARNNDNTMELRVSTFSGNAQAVLNGFYHRLLQNMRLEFPMPGNETTYYVVLELNPLKADTSEGPISVKVYPNELNTESGRTHLILWKVTRKSNQLLTDASVEAVRPRVVSTHLVYTRDQLPDPGESLWGSMYFVHATSEILMAVGANQESNGPTRWKNLTSPEWVESTSVAFPWAGHGEKPAHRVVGDRVELRGRVKRHNGTNFYGGNSYTLIPNCPDIGGRTVTMGGCTQSRDFVTMDANPNSQAKPIFEFSNDSAWADLTGLFYYRLTA